MAAGSSPHDAFQPAEGVYAEPTAKRIRAMLGGHTVFDTTEAMLVWEHRFYPQYYIPREAVAPGVLAPTGVTSHHERLGGARHFAVRVGRHEVADGARCHPDAPDERLRSLIRFDWDALDAWFEEDQEVFVHPRSPYVRIDVLESSRKVRVDLDGVTVASSNRPKLLFETGAPVRYYLPKTDVRFELLNESTTSTSCPYKGTARYWSVVIDGDEYHDLAWGYDTPLAESLGIAGLVCFYADRVDLIVDGRPV